MSEKRFTLEQWTEESLYFSDGEFSAHMSIGYVCKKVEKKLNEQQATITELESDKAIAEDYANIFEKENVKLRKKLNEQQDIIFKLQDLCGKSDYENAKLRQEIKELKAQLREKEEDEQLYANEILELREANKEFIQFKELGGDY